VISLSNVILNFWERASSSSWQSHDPGQLKSLATNTMPSTSRLTTSRFNYLGTIEVKVV